MGFYWYLLKLPVLVDSGVLVVETAAIIAENTLQNN